VPLKNFREGVPFAFHQDTAALYRYLAGRLKDHATIEVVADDDEYVEVSLHGASHRLSTIVVNYVLAPVVINLLSSYLYDELKTMPHDNVELTIVIEDHECRAMKLGFKGEAKDLALIADKVGQMSRDCTRAANAREHSHGFSHHSKTHVEDAAHEAANSQSSTSLHSVSPESATLTDRQPKVMRHERDGGTQGRSE